MSLRYALLGFLSTEAASGYAIAGEFSEAMGWFWHASHSQIYPELRRMEEEGLVRSRPPGDAAGRTKRVYELTDAGESALRSWLHEDVEYTPARDPERTRLIYLDDLPVSVVRRHFQRHREHHMTLLKIYEDQLRQNYARTHPRLRKRLATRPPERHEFVVGLKVLALQGNVQRARNEIAWADDALQWLEGFPEEDAVTQHEGRP